MLGKFNPSRLKLARTRRKLTIKGLAEKVGLTPRMVSEYEKDYCKNCPPEGTIDAFSKALNYPAEFFLDPEPIEAVAKETVSFRSLKSMKAADEHAAISAGELGVIINTYFEETFSLPESNVPDYRGIEAEVAAEALRDEWNLGCHSISSMVHLLEKNGVRVFSLSENTQDVDAFSFWKDGVPYVFLNTQKSGERSRFDAAHELGHLILHKHGVPQGKNIEAEADKFASFFLMPRVTLLPLSGKAITIDSILKLKHKWKVSAMALIVHLKTVEILSDWQYKTLIVTASKLGLRTKEINGIEREKSLIIDKLLKALENDGIYLKSLSTLLKLPIDELLALIFKVGTISSNDKPSSIQNTASKPVLRLVK